MFQEELDIDSPELMSAKQKDIKLKQEQGKLFRHSSKTSKKRPTRAAKKLRKIYAEK